MTNLRTLIEDHAAAHVVPHGGTCTFRHIDGGVHLRVSHGDWTADEHVILRGLPEEIGEEYLHCKIHALAARLIAHLYPV